MRPSRTSSASEIAGDPRPLRLLNAVRQTQKESALK